MSSFESLHGVTQFRFESALRWHQTPHDRRLKLVACNLAVWPTKELEASRDFMFFARILTGNRCNEHPPLQRGALKFFEKTNAPSHSPERARWKEGPNTPNVLDAPE